MSDSLAERCREFSKKVHLCSAPEDYYFQSVDGKPMRGGNIYKNFRRFLWRARISHRGKGYGPRIHDFRHTYAVHCLKKWTEQEKNLVGRGISFTPKLKLILQFRFIGNAPPSDPCVRFSRTRFPIKAFPALAIACTGSDRFSV